ncbi:MAG: hypothetical protein R3B70_34120 [Polyangiaceae bacterium]
MAFSASRIFAPLLLAPTNGAASHFASDRVAQGLEELSPDNLRAALTRAIDAVAAHVSASPEAVRRVLPMPEVDAVLARLAATQPAVVAAWRGYAGGLGGLIGRISQTPGDGAAPSVSDRIQTLAETMQRDKVISRPLHAVAEDVAAWEALAARLVDLVGSAKELRGAYRMRQIKRAAVVVTVAAILITIAVIARSRYVARSNVLAATGKDDPCAAFDLHDEDLARVSDELRATVTAKRTACEERRAAEARRIEEERKRKEREDAERRAREKREADCEALAKHVEEGKLTAADESFAADAGFTKRIAEGALEGRDFGPADPVMPCAGSKVEARLWDSFRKAVLQKPWIMLVTTAPAPRVRAAFVPDGGKMPFKLRKVIATRANDLAKAAVRTGKVDEATRASAWCEVARAVGMPMAGPCDISDKIVAGKR